MEKILGKTLIGDEKLITPSSEIIDVSRLGFFDELEYDSWNLFLQYCDAFGIEVEERDEPDWYISKQIQDKIIELLIESGVKFKFK